MRFAIGNAQHPGRRHGQQDAFAFSNPNDEAFVKHAGLLAILADGMGGLAHGDLASRTACDAFLRAYREKTAQETVEDALRRALQKSNEAVCALAERLSGSDLGTTLVAAALVPDGGRLVWISVGDSGLFLLRDGRLQMLAMPHTFAADLDQYAATGAISKRDALENPQRDALTSHLGMKELPHIDENSMALAADDRALLASDGLFKTLLGPEMEAAFQPDLQKSCDALVANTLAKEMPHQDNVTVLAVALETSKPPATPVYPKTVVIPPSELKVDPPPPVQPPPAAPPPKPNGRPPTPTLKWLLGGAAVLAATGFGYTAYRWWDVPPCPRHITVQPIQLPAPEGGSTPSPPITKGAHKP